jgi:hypothetical protein
MCGKEKKKSDFYKSYSIMHKADGLFHFCKSCMESLIDVEDYRTVINLMRMIDRPYIHSLWIGSLEENPNKPFGVYMKNLGMPQNRDKTWDDSEFEGTGWKDSVFIYDKSDEQKNQDKEIKTNSTKKEFVVTDEIIDKWGVGYSPQEYEFFEKKYNILKNNYTEKTSMHTEALLTYIRYRVKEEMATARGDVKEAKEWGQLAQKAAQDAKINPSQLSKADLSDGLDTIGQLVRAVEQAVDIIPILPRFKEKPHDKPDFTIWCYVNYLRDLEGKPLVKYEDVYKFYEERKKEYETDFGVSLDEDGEE